ncbi:MAG: hypothetical protein M9962_00505 [Oligoflexia bacterium]|nr:hypothetical protein [Oligoflexia bacterium]
MKFALLACLLFSLPYAAKAENKINQKTGLTVAEEQSLDIYTEEACYSGCGGGDRHYRKDPISNACERYTSTNSAERLCKKIRSNPAVTKSCYFNTSTYSNEERCIYNQTPPVVAEGCKKYTMMKVNEALCMDLLTPPRVAKHCCATSRNGYEERDCLLDHSGIRY